MRQESHRIYLQQFVPRPASSSQSSPTRTRGGDSTVATTSAAVRLTDVAKTADVTRLLRGKFGLPGDSGASGSTDRLDKIRSRLSEFHVTPVEAPLPPPSLEPGNVDTLVLVATLTGVPKGYVAYEHEEGKKQDDSCPEPYNLMRTLGPTEKPLVIRDEIVRLLNARLRQANDELGLEPPSDQQQPLPQVRWFFQPRPIGGKASNVLGCVDVDGYCSGVEDIEDDENGEEQLIDHSNDAKDEDMDQKSSDIAERWWTKGSLDLRDTREYSLNKVFLGAEQAFLSEERHRFANLLRQEAALNENETPIQGYLLKRCKHDFNVWHRVNCILTEDSLYCVTRLKAGPIAGICSEERTFSAKKYLKGRPTEKSRIGRHSRIDLNSTLLIESDPTQTSNPLSSVPNSFEIICPTGTSHFFRVPRSTMNGSSADPRSICKRWVAAISERIIGCFEANGMELAELIGSEEASARWGRMKAESVAPLWKNLEESYSSSTKGKISSSISSWNARVGDGFAATAEIMRFGLDVFQFKETVRNAEGLCFGYDGKTDDSIVGRARLGAISLAWIEANRVVNASSLFVALLESSQGTSGMVRTLIEEDGDEGKGDKDKLRRKCLSCHRKASFYLEEQNVLREVASRGGTSAEQNSVVSLVPPADLFDELLLLLQSLAISTEKHWNLNK